MNLKEFTDDQLIHNIKSQNDSDSFLELKSRHEKLFYSICSSYCSKVRMLKYEDVIENCDFILNKAIQSYENNKKTKFSSWLGNQSRYFCLNTIKYLNELN